MKKKRIDQKQMSNKTVAVAKEPRVKVTRWNEVAVWAWDPEGMTFENCPICRSHLLDLCSDCQAQGVTGDAAGCTQAWGQCNHAFHWHCISRWLKTREVCPLDNREWELNRLGL